MISLKTRESFSSRSIEAETSIDKTIPGTYWPGSLLLTLFITTFFCRFSQTSLLAAVQFNGPISDWFAPCTSLLLLPAATFAITAGFTGVEKKLSTLTSTLVILAAGLAAIAVLLGTQAYATTLIACSIIFISGVLEIIRLCVWTHIISDITKNQTNYLLVQLVLTEAAATAFSVNISRATQALLPTVDSLRFSSLFLTATFLLSFFFYSHKKLDFRSKEMRERQEPLWKRYPFSSMFLSTATNVTVVTLLVLTLSSKVVAGIPLSSFWSACAIGMLFGGLYCLIPTGKPRSSRLLIAFLLSYFSCALCIYKPTGPTLFAGLFLVGFAATIATVTSFCHFSKLDRTASPAFYIGFQTAFTYILSFVSASILEPRIEDLSSFVFVRLLAISQLIFLTSLGSLSYILYKYRRSQS